MHNLELVLENDTYKVLCKFEIQMNHLISARLPDLKKKKKKKNNCWIVDLAVSADHRVKLKKS